MKYLLIFLSSLGVLGQSVPSTYPYPRPLSTNGSTPNTTIKMSAVVNSTAYNETRPALWDVFLGGSYRSVGTLAERDSINQYIRKEGMMVWVAANHHTYILGSDLITWTDIGTPATWGSGGATTIYNSDDSLTGNRTVNGANHTLAFERSPGFNAWGNTTADTGDDKPRFLFSGGTNLFPSLALPFQNWNGVGVMNHPLPQDTLGQYDAYRQPSLLFMGDNTDGFQNPFNLLSINSIQLGGYGLNNQFGFVRDYLALKLDLVNKIASLDAQTATPSSALTTVTVTPTEAGFYIREPSDGSVYKKLSFSADEGFVVTRLPSVGYYPGPNDSLKLLVYNPTNGLVARTELTMGQAAKNLENSDLSIPSSPPRYITSYYHDGSLIVTNLSYATFSSVHTRISGGNDLLLEGYNLHIHPTGWESAEYGQVLSFAAGNYPANGYPDSVKYATLFWRSKAMQSSSGVWYSTNLWPGPSGTEAILPSQRGEGSIAYVAFNGDSVGNDTFQLGNDIAAPLWLEDNTPIKAGDIKVGNYYLLIRAFGTIGPAGRWIVSSPTTKDFGRVNIVNVTTDYTMLPTDCTIIQSNAGTTINLVETAIIGGLYAPMHGKIVTVKNSDSAGVVTVTAGALIDGDTSVTVHAKGATTFQYNGSGWYIISKF